MPKSPIRWVRGLDPLAADALLAAMFAMIDLLALAASTKRPEGIRDPNFLAVVLLLAQSVPIVWRRRRPVAVLVLTTAGFAAYHVMGFPTDVPGGGSLVALYSVAAYCPRRRAAAAGAVAIGGLTVFSLVGVAFTDQVRLVDVAPSLALLATIWVVGSGVQAKRSHAVVLEERAALLEREKEDKARRAVADERSRIARELHDVVAHNVSVMVVQAGAARRVIDADTAGAKEAMASVEATGRQALVEMRRLLGVLRVDDEATDARGPQPGIDQVDNLAASVREAGLPVELTVVGEPRALPAGVDLSAYRIVQEALTNALKHAGPARARVVLSYGESWMEVSVTDDGRGSSSHPTEVDGEGSGHGMLGMRERVALFGGELRASPRVGGGYGVTARFPV